MVDHIYMLRAGVEVAILCEGQRLPIYEYDGHKWIAGRPGAAYSIAVRLVPKTRQQRVEVLESVDGRDVLKDQAASLQSSGMVISSEWINSGWRIDDNTVREFVFSDPSQSIAAQATGSVGNVGVIGVAVYHEKIYSPPSQFGMGGIVNASRMASDSAVSPEVSVKSLTGDLGTGMGAERRDSVGHTHFVRDIGPTEMIEIQYRTEAWLRERGIIKSDLPSAWPSSSTGYGKYAK